MRTPFRIPTDRGSLFVYLLIIAIMVTVVQLTPEDGPAECNSGHSIGHKANSTYCVKGE